VLYRLVLSLKGKSQPRPHPHLQPSSPVGRQPPATSRRRRTTPRRAGLAWPAALSDQTSASSTELGSDEACSVICHESAGLSHGKFFRRITNWYWAAAWHDRFASTWPFVLPPAFGSFIFPTSNYALSQSSSRQRRGSVEFIRVSHSLRLKSIS